MTRARSLNHRTCLITLSVAVLLIFGGACVEAQDIRKSRKGIVVVDGLGREIRLDGPAQRVYVSYGITGTMVYALGAQDQLVGIDPEAKKEAVYVALPSKSRREFNIEDAIALNADLILVPGRNPQLVEDIEARGLKVFGIVAEDWGQLKYSMINLSKALGKEDRAQQFVRYYDDMVDRIQRKTVNLGSEERPALYMVGPSLLTTCGSDMYQHYLITLAGGRNGAATDSAGLGMGDGWFDVSPEQIVKWNPDTIVLVQDAANATPRQILTDRRFASISAANDGQVFWFPSN